jgi:hypothetical protein
MEVKRADGARVVSKQQGMKESSQGDIGEDDKDEDFT